MTIQSDTECAKIIVLGPPRVGKTSLTVAVASMLQMSIESLYNAGKLNFESSKNLDDFFKISIGYKTEATLTFDTIFIMGKYFDFGFLSFGGTGPSISEYFLKFVEDYKIDFGKDRVILVLPADKVRYEVESISILKRIRELFYLIYDRSGYRPFEYLDLIILNKIDLIDYKTETLKERFKELIDSRLGDYLRNFNYEGNMVVSYLELWGYIKTKMFEIKDELGITETNIGLEIPYSKFRIGIEKILNLNDQRFQSIKSKAIKYKDLNIDVITAILNLCREISTSNLLELIFGKTVQSIDKYMERLLR